MTGKRVLIFFLISSLLSIFFGVHGNLLIILLKSCKILTSLGELSLFHTFSNIPVDKGTLGIHEIKLVINTTKSLCNCRVVGNHAACTFSLGNISIGDLAGRLGVDSSLESSWTPVHELNSALIFYGGHGHLDIRGSDISTVHEAARHEFSMGRITLCKKRRGLSHDGSSQLGDGKGLMVGLLTGHKRSVGRNEHVETRIRDKNSGEIIDVHIERSRETKRGSQ
mmetsp:Transcript_10551/g.19690  ORF Transcript_10551/g.19690 Transcript_10551/m.19690 type:complete len:224 (-) Transcript_10551:795-1466(-)